MHARTLLALSAALLFATPAVAAAAPARGASSTRLGALLGFEDGNGDTGLSLRLDGELDQQLLSPQVRLSFVGSLGFSRWNFDNGFFSDLDASLNIFKFVPAARFSLGRSPNLRPYLDAGIGLYYASFNVEFRDPFTGFVDSDSTSDVGLMMRFAGGMLFDVSPGLSLGGELGLTPYFGDVDDTTFSLMFSAVFRI